MTSEEMIDTQQKCKHSHLQPNKKGKLFNGLLILLLANLLWFIFRTGTKPTRITYPCQKAALRNISILLGSIIPLISISALWFRMKNWAQRKKSIILIFIILAPLTGGILLHSTSFAVEIGLSIEPNTSSTDEFSSDIFVVNGRDVAHIENLIDLMGSNNLSFYQSSTIAENTAEDGLIAKDDVVLIKNNCQWDQRGGTNTDMLVELITTIIDHPDGFVGEIVIADNGQGRGSMDWAKTNAEDKKQSVMDIVNDYNTENKISCFLWDTIRNDQVNEFSDGDLNDGYILNTTADSNTGIYTSYPKFTTEYNTKISFKNGIWNGTHFEPKLKVINAPVLKSHSSYGVTAALKHYVGLQSQGLANGHSKVATGGMGTLMVEFGLPTLNILDAIWVNANPEKTRFTGPGTDYSEATRVNILMASTDPVALDYWAAKYVLMQAATQIGYTDIYSLDPTSSNSNGLTESFGIWLNLTRDELARGGYNITTDENKMNIFANSLVVLAENTNISNNFWIWIGVGGSSTIVVIVTIFFILKRRRNRKIA